MKQSLIACHTCDLLHRVKPLPVRSHARCRRCGTLLYSHTPQSAERTLAWAIAGLVMVVIANAYPFLSLQSQGTVLETNLITGAIILSEQSMAGLALLVLLTSMLVPCILLGALVYVLWPLNQGYRLPASRRMFRLALALRPWSMTEVFLLGILVSVIKLAKLATIIPGTALFAFLALVFALAAVNTLVNPHSIWEEMDRCP
jgi:paraquat-inducible protein A